jgi:transketolase
VILLATGSEVELAMAVAERLRGRGSAPTSSPCRARAVRRAAAAYREDILPDVSNRLILRASIEAGSTIGLGALYRACTACASASTASALGPAPTSTPSSASPPTPSSRDLAKLISTAPSALMTMGVK